MNLFNYILEGKELHSGDKSNFFIDCDALSDKDIEALARMIATRVEPFVEVLGVPKGGLRLAAELDVYKDKRSNNILIVDDVLTTGKSIAEYMTLGSQYRAIGAVIFDRSNGKCPDWVTPLFVIKGG